MIPLLPFNPLLIVIAALAVALAGSGIWGAKQNIKLNETRVELANEKTSRAEENKLRSLAYAKESEDNRRKEQELLTGLNQVLKERDEQVQSSTVAASELMRRLRAVPAQTAASAPTGPASSAPGAAAFAEGSHGARLREEAGTLVEEAHRANLIRAGLEACYAAYEKARAALMGARP